MPQEPRLDVGRGQRLTKQGVRAKIDLTDGEVIRRAPVGVEGGQLRARERGVQGRAPRSEVWMAESIQKFSPAGRVNVQNSSTALGSVLEPATRASLTSSTV